MEDAFDYIVIGGGSGGVRGGGGSLLLVLVMEWLQEMNGRMDEELHIMQAWYTP